MFSQDHYRVVIQAIQNAYGIRKIPLSQRLYWMKELKILFLDGFLIQEIKDALLEVKHLQDTPRNATFFDRIRACILERRNAKKVKTHGLHALGDILHATTTQKGTQE